MRRESKSNIVSRMLFDKFFDDNYKSIVVLANPKTILNAKYAKKEVKQMVIRADQLINYIKNANQQSQRGVSSDKEMKEIAEILLALHTPNNSDYAKKYEDIINNMKVLSENEPDKEKLPEVKPIDEEETKNIGYVLKEC